MHEETVLRTEKDGLQECSNKI